MSNPENKPGVVHYALVLFVMMSVDVGHVRQFQTGLKAYETWGLINFFCGLP